MPLTRSQRLFIEKMTPAQRDAEIVEKLVDILEALSPASGGSTVTYPEQTRVETSANGGDDATGELGDPSKPFETAQAAWDAGANTIFFGPGNHAGMTITGTGTKTLSVMGNGVGANSRIDYITLDGPNSLYIQDLGYHSVNIAAINAQGVSGLVDGESGTGGKAITLSGVTCGPVNNSGGNGFLSTNVGGNGGDAGSILIIDSEVESITSNGGNAGAGDAATGLGGAGGTLVFQGAFISGATACSGGAGDPAGMDGTITAKMSYIDSAPPVTSGASYIGSFDASGPLA